MCRDIYQQTNPFFRTTDPFSLLPLKKQQQFNKYKQTRTDHIFTALSASDDRHNDYRIPNLLILLLLLSFVLMETCQICNCMEFYCSKI